MAPIADPEARRKYQREWLQRRREEYLEGKSCAVCGSTDRLEIDHRDPDDKDPKLRGENRGNGSMWSWSRKRLADELLKTQILCHEHHMDKTKLQRLQAVDKAHGTPWRYKTGKCRCDDCRGWNAQSKAERLARQKMTVRGGEPMP